MSIFFRLFGIIIIGVLEFYALSKGINGVALATATTFIGGLCGFELAKVIQNIKLKKERLRNEKNL